MTRTRRRAVNPARREKKRERRARREATAEAPAQPVAAVPAEAAAAPLARRPITMPTAAPAAPAPRRAVARSSQPTLHTDYAIIGRDLRRVGLLSGALLLALVVLTVVLR